MRLIDADKLTDGEGVFSDVVHIDFEKGGGYIMVEDLLNILDNQPTAYDVDKVMEEFERVSIPEDKVMYASSDEFGQFVRLEDAVKIVKSCGIE